MNASSMDGAAVPFVVLVFSLIDPFVPFVFEGGSVKTSSIDGWGAFVGACWLSGGLAGVGVSAK